MARRSFTVVDVTEILIHWYAGRSLSEVSDSLGVDRKTIRKYLAPAVAAGITPGGPARAAGQGGAVGGGRVPPVGRPPVRGAGGPPKARHPPGIRRGAEVWGA